MQGRIRGMFYIPRSMPEWIGLSHDQLNMLWSVRREEMSHRDLLILEAMRYTEQQVPESKKRRIKRHLIMSIKRGRLRSVRDIQFALTHFGYPEEPEDFEPLIGEFDDFQVPIIGEFDDFQVPLIGEFDDLFNALVHLPEEEQDYILPGAEDVRSPLDIDERKEPRVEVVGERSMRK